MSALDAIARLAMQAERVGPALARGGRAARLTGQMLDADPVFMGRGAIAGAGTGALLGGINAQANGQDIGAGALQGGAMGLGGGIMAGGALGALNRIARMGGAGARAMMRSPTAVELMEEVGAHTSNPALIRQIESILQTQGPDAARQALAQMLRGPG
jgi:hypothetical protein